MKPKRGRESVVSALCSLRGRTKEAAEEIEILPGPVVLQKRMQKAECQKQAGPALLIVSVLTSAYASPPSGVLSGAGGTELILQTLALYQSILKDNTSELLNLEVSFA